MESHSFVDQSSLAPQGLTATAKAWLNEEFFDPKNHKTVENRQQASESISSLGAATAGVIVFSAATIFAPKPLKTLCKPAVILANTLGAITSGAATKYGIKTALQDLWLSESDRHVSKADLAWGAVDGAAGLVATVSEKWGGQNFVRKIGAKALDTAASKETIEVVGLNIIKENVLTRAKYNGLRGLIGGASGTGFASLAHHSVENTDEIKNNPGRGLAKTLLQTTEDAALGGVVGYGIGGGGTLIGDVRHLVGASVNKLVPNAERLPLHRMNIGDFHSAIDQLPAIKTLVETRTAANKALGIDSEFTVSGDVRSGNINDTWGSGGRVEMDILSPFTSKYVYGNHEYDGPKGFNVHRWFDLARDIKNKNPNLKFYSQLDFSAYPEASGLAEPYTIATVNGPKGPVEVATIGLTTKEGAVNNISYVDATKSALATIRELNNRGIHHIELITHIGLEEDKKLAQTILDNNLKVSHITGGHSHDVTPTPIWIEKSPTLLSQLKFWQPKEAIPIIHTGSSGRWVSDLNLSVRPDGLADRFRTTFKLHAIKPDMPFDQKLRTEIDGIAAERTALKEQKYDAAIPANFSLRNVRKSETPLGNLIADSLYSQSRQRLVTAPDLVLHHSGGTRADLFATSNASRIDFANLLMHSGNPEEERAQLALLKMTGAEVKQALEFGVHDIPQSAPQPLREKFASLFRAPTEQPDHDETGNFLQIAGGKYSFDLSAPEWSRVRNLQIADDKGRFVEFDPSKTYNVLTRYHAVDKWMESKGFGGNETRSSLSAQGKLSPVGISQIDMLGDAARGKTLLPSKDGRITNLTPRTQTVPLRPGFGVLSYGAMQTIVENKNDKSIGQ